MKPFWNIVRVKYFPFTCAWDSIKFNCTRYLKVSEKTEILYIFLFTFQVRFTFRLALRRSFRSYYCDENTINVGGIIGSGGSWKAKCSDPFSAVCSLNYYIADTRFRCTDFSRNEDWSMGENNFTYTFPSGNLEWDVRWVNMWIKRKRNSWKLTFLECFTFLRQQKASNKQEPFIMTKIIFQHWGDLSNMVTAEGHHQVVVMTRNSLLLSIASILSHSITPFFHSS